MGKYPTHKLRPLVIFSFFYFFLVTSVLVGRLTLQTQKTNNFLKRSPGLHLNNSFCCSQRPTKWPSIPSGFALCSHRGGDVPTQLHASSTALSDCVRGISAWTLSRALSNQLAAPAAKPWLQFHSVSNAPADGAAPATGEALWPSSSNLLDKYSYFFV